MLSWLAGAIVSAVMGGTSCAGGAGGGTGGAATGGVGTGGVAAGGRTGGAGGGSQLDAGSTADAAATGDATAEELCPEVPLRRQSSGTPLSFTFAYQVSGQPLQFGEANAFAGGSLTPLNLRFFISELAVARADGTVTPLDLLQDGGAPEPYGAHLVNAEDAPSMTISTIAPPGAYTELRFTLGLNNACNGGSSTRKWPLDDSSQMTWPHLPGVGYLFFRFEGRWAASTGAGGAGGATGSGKAPVTAVHMGGFIGSLFAPHVTVKASLQVPSQGALKKTIDISLDEILAAAGSADVTSQFPAPLGPEVDAGDRLRQLLPTRTVFTLEGP